LSVTVGPRQIAGKPIKRRKHHPKVQPMNFQSRRKNGRTASTIGNTLMVTASEKAKAADAGRFSAYRAKKTTIKRSRTGAGPRANPSPTNGKSAISEPSRSANGPCKNPARAWTGRWRSNAFAQT
jgi:hypothetical protein